MQFKNIKKSPSKKMTTPKKASDNVKKEEIKEIIEETVEEVLKEQSDSTAQSKVSSVEIAATVEGEKETAQDNNGEEKDESNITPVQLSDTPFGEHPEENAETKEDKNAQELASAEQSEGEEKHEEEKEDVKPDKVESPTPAVAVVDVSPFSTPQPAVENQNNTSDSPRKSSMLKLFLLFMFLGIVAGAVVWFIAFHNIFSLKLPDIPGIYSAVKPTPTKAPSLTLSPTPKPVDISQYPITVLNGSGIGGAAAKAEATLTGAGFTVSSTGNADNSNFTETVIAAKSSVAPEALDKLKQTLSETYAVSSQILAVSDSQTADIVVTIGSTRK